MLLPGGNWIGRLEYLHYGFGTIADTGVITNAAGTAPLRAGNQGVDVLRAGVSYKFGDPAASAPVHYAKTPLPCAIIGLGRLLSRWSCRLWLAG